MSRLGIIAALPGEAKCLYSKNINIASPVEIQEDMFLCLSGMGYEAAQTGICELMELNINTIVNWGVAGSIHDSLKSGDLVIADSIVGQEQTYSTTLEWTNKIKESLKIKTGPIASIPDMCVSTEDKYNLHKKTDALAVDMESAAIAEQAINNNMDFVVIRAIADDANTQLPEAVVKHTNELGKPRLIGFLSSCLKKPGQIKDIVGLANSYNKALNTLKLLAPDLKKQHFLYNTRHF